MTGLTESQQQEGRGAVSADDLRKKFLEAPDGEKLVELYAALHAEGNDDQIASILAKVRPIQHRVTLVQADVQAPLLEVLCRDPHPQVRQVVAGHANISTEVCVRLCEDQQSAVRLALRKNPSCHPVIRAALILREREDARWEQLVELVWEGRRAGVDTAALLALIEEWTGAGPEELSEMTQDDINLVLDVLDAKVSGGALPKKARKPNGKKKASKKR